MPDVSKFKKTAEAYRASRADRSEQDPAAETPAWKRYLPHALAAAGVLGAGAGAYHLLRRGRMSGNPVLDGVRRQAGTHGFHQVVDVSHGSAEPLDKNDPLHLKAWHALNEWRQPRVNAEGNLDLVNRLKLRALYGPGAIAAGSTPDGKTYRIDGAGRPTQEPLHVQGVVSNRNIDAFHGGHLGAHIQGGSDIEGSDATKKLVSSLGSGGKRVEADLLQRFAPDAIPKTELDLTKLHPKDTQALMQTPQGRRKLVNAMKQRAGKTFGREFMLKPTIGLQSGGEFPNHEGNWGKSLAAYEKHFANPKNLEKFKSMGDVDQAWYLKDRGLYEGHTLNAVLKDPKSAIMQEYVPNYNNEYRVHSVAGQPMQAHSRWFTGEGTHVPDKELYDFVRNVTQRLPQEYQGGHFGFDVGVGMDPKTNKRILKVIEMNPYEQRGPGNSGGGSGFLDPHVIPGAGRAMYRHATGRMDPLRAGAGALGVAGVAGAGGALLGHKLRGHAVAPREAGAEDAEDADAPSAKKHLPRLGEAAVSR